MDDATLTAAPPSNIARGELAYQATKSDRERLPLATQSDTESITKQGRQVSVSARIGGLFVAAAFSSLLCALVSHGFAGNAALQALMWLAAVSFCCLAGVMSMRTVRTLQVIESELYRLTGHPGRWQSVRPVIGKDRITQGWNELLAEVKKSSINQLPQRSSAALDQEVITLARAMRGLPTAWVITDKGGRVKYMSGAAYALFGINDDVNIVGRDLPEMLGLRESDDETAAPTLDRLLSDLRMVRERRKIVVETRELHLRIQRSILAGRSGDGQGMAWVLADVTQQNLATQARDQFLMTATHELRTPLNNLQAYAEALQEEEDLEVERQKEFCNVIVSESHRLGRLVDQLLTVGQMEAGSMIAARNELEILPLVDYASDQMRATADKKSQKLITDFAQKLPTVFGDREKLQAALVNLVGNAVKYTPEGGEIIVRCFVDGNWVRVDVQDNGPGIASEEHAKVFEKFYRGSNASESEQRGNGLGLAFTREVIRMHGGDVELESELGEGSRFTMRLPIGGQSRSGI